MALETLEQQAPPFFRKGFGLLRLFLLCALSVFLMVQDSKNGWTSSLRYALASALLPMETLVYAPAEAFQSALRYFVSLQSAQQKEEDLRLQVQALSLQAQQVVALRQEQQRLTQLLGLKDEWVATQERTPLAAQVLGDRANTYSRELTLNRGGMHGVVAGAPVINVGGVLGQITEVLPARSTVTLLTDPGQSIPVLNTRTGARSVAYGSSLQPGLLELRFVPATADVQKGDELSTSGLDSIYPAHLKVATVHTVSHHSDSAFALISAQPAAEQGGSVVLILLPAAKAASTTTAPGVQP